MSEEQYVATIAELDREGLLELWAQIQEGDTPGWPPGKAFEYLVLRAFQLDGADVQWPYPVYMGNMLTEQIDGAVYAEGLSCLIESKHHESSVDVTPIAKLQYQLKRRPSGTIGVVFAYRGFTGPALSLAQHSAPQTILLWTGSEVEYALNNGKMVAGLRLKYRYAVEYGLPDGSLVELE